MRLVATLLSATLLAAPAYAQDDPPAEESVETTADGRTIVRKDVTRLEFDTLDIDASVQRPSIDLIGERRSATFNPLIKLRTDFNDEMDHSVTAVK